MDEIRFNQPQKEEPKEENKENKKGRLNLKPLFKKVLKVLIIAVILIVVAGAVFWGRDLVVKIFKNKNEVYSAVFLANGQVYFGKMIENNDMEITLTNVFYIQINEKTAGQQENVLGQTSFNLIKLGNELHGPTDELFINRSQVVFYEKLRDDSKVVESIKNYK